MFRIRKVVAALGLAMLVSTLGVGVGPAQAAEGAADSATHSAAADGAWKKVASTKNKCGHREFLRRGNGKSWGFQKIARKHNITKPRVWKAVIHKTCGVRDGNSTT